MKEVATKPRGILDYYSAVTMKFSGHSSADPVVRRQKIEEHFVTHLVLRNNENRPSLTSGAAPVAEELHEASSNNTIEEMTAAITGCKDIGLWLANLPKNAGLLVKNWKGTVRHCDEKLFLNHDVPQHPQHRKETRNGNAQ